MSSTICQTSPKLINFFVKQNIADILPTFAQTCAWLPNLSTIGKFWRTFLFSKYFPFSFAYKLVEVRKIQSRKQLENVIIEKMSEMTCVETKYPSRCRISHATQEDADWTQTEDLRLNRWLAPSKKKMQKGSWWSVVPFHLRNHVSKFLETVFVRREEGSHVAY